MPDLFADDLWIELVLAAWRDQCDGNQALVCVATDRATRDSKLDGDTTFLRCSIWRQAAENVSQSLTKGSRVLATGRLKQRSWETDNGDKRSVMELDIDEIGPSLRWATATVTKATRTSTPPSAGTWTQAAPAAASAGSGFSDEPPF